MVGPDGKLPLQPHNAVSNELYSSRFRSLLYWLQHDYNESAAETLGVLDDHGHGVDWAWDDQESQISLRWHGAHPSPLGDSGRSDPFAAHDDLVLTAVLPGFGWRDAATSAGTIMAVLLVMGGILWALAQKVFLFEVGPLKMTGTRQVAESLRKERMS